MSLMTFLRPDFVGGVRFQSTFKPRRDSATGDAQVCRSVILVYVDERQQLKVEAIQCAWDWLF